MNDDDEGSRSGASKGEGTEEMLLTWSNAGGEEERMDCNFSRVSSFGVEASVGRWECQRVSFSAPERRGGA